MLSDARRFRRLASLLVKARRCPFCGWAGFRFEPFGNRMTHRTDAQCPWCGSLERHRTAFVMLRDRIERGQRILHVAPEPALIRWLVSLSTEYLNIDLVNPAMCRMDLTALDLADESRTLIWCSHVLEHIPEDRKALSEMFRVLAPGGQLVLQVPIRGAVTNEHPSVVTAADRLYHYLQEDHVRLYGLDLKQRIEDCGFICNVLTTEMLPLQDQVRYSLRTPLYRDVFLCQKPA